MGRLTGFTYADVARKLRKIGFEYDRQAKGSHEVWRQASTGRRTTIANHPGHIPEGTMRAIVRQIGLSVDEFLLL